MNTFYNEVKKNEKDEITTIKTEEKWNIYKEKLDVSLQTEKHRNNYLKYGSIY